MLNWIAKLFRRKPAKGSTVKLNITTLRAWAQEAEHAASAEVQRFVQYVEGKTTSIDAAIQTLEAAGYVVTEAPPAP